MTRASLTPSRAQPCDARVLHLASALQAHRSLNYFGISQSDRIPIALSLPARVFLGAVGGSVHRQYAPVSVSQSNLRRSAACFRTERVGQNLAPVGGQL